MTLRLSTTGSQLNSIAVERLKAGIFKFKIVPDQIGKGELHLIMGSDSQEFIRLARAVYFENDERAKVKKDINLALGSTYVEEKSYSDYHAPGAARPTRR